MMAVWHISAHPPNSHDLPLLPQLDAGADGQLSAREVLGSNPCLMGRVRGRPEDQGQRAGVTTGYPKGAWSPEIFTPLRVRSTLVLCERLHRSPGC